MLLLLTLAILALQAVAWLALIFEFAILAAAMVHPDPILNH